MPHSSRVGALAAAAAIVAGSAPLSGPSVGSLPTVKGPSSPAALAFDWPSFLARADPVWSWGGANATGVQPTEWVQSLFGGNGDLGFMLWAPTAGELQLHVNRQTLWDDRTPDLGLPYYLGNFALDQPRLPLGYFSITLGSGADLSAAAGRVSLWDAVASLNLTTARGSCALAAWASAQHDRARGGADVVVLETSWSGGETCAVSWVPLPCESTWSGNDKRYVFNPPPLNASRVLNPETELTTVSQPHLPVKGTWHSTAVLRSQLQPAAAAYVVTVSPVLGSQAAADAWAAAEVGAAVAAGLPALRAAHSADWHAWWPAGGALTVEYSALEAFWYTQLFKFRSGARPGVVHDLEGPWFIQDTPWPDLHWDMSA